MEGRLSPSQTTVKVTRTFLSQYQYCWLYAGISAAYCTRAYMMAGNSCRSGPIAEINNSKTHTNRNSNIMGKLLLPENGQRKHVSANRKQNDAEIEWKDTNLGANSVLCFLFINFGSELSFAQITLDGMFILQSVKERRRLAYDSAE
jgi:hypothetical protein